MSYQVLARKWRPQNFKQMVGQEHVLRALIHALDSERLHHAYLFTGTRGVGKTTIGRILAKCLSCQQRITSEPCGQCDACLSISAGRYVDLIEIDAASRTKVEDMRELLENVQYAPSQGRFKIYLIDEVHMLSQSSFNALLKTLEEPPSHVKFLFATTDPQKLPVTILSRCLQFNLKNMSPEKIVEHLKHILDEEQVQFEEAALWALARAAEGSMRDALSLTDQAIAYGNNTLTETGVSTMLGTVDQKKVYRILDALIRKDASAMLKEVQLLADFSPDYRSVLASLAAILHRIALEQVVPGSVDNAMGDQAQIQFYAKQLCAEDVQLFYQIALTSRQDLQITPDAKTGFEMALLRMLAFQISPYQGEQLPPLVNTSPDELPVQQIPQVPEPETRDDSRDEQLTAVTTEIDESEPQVMVTEEGFSAPISDETSDYAPFLEGQADIDQYDPSLIDAIEETTNEPVGLENSGHEQPELPAGEKKKPDLVTNDAAAAWNQEVNDLGLSGMTLNFLLNSVLDKTAEGLKLYVEAGHFRLVNENHEKRIREALLAYYPGYEQLEIIEGLTPDQETPMMMRERFLNEKKQKAKEMIVSDPYVSCIIETFQANLIDSSIQPEG